MELYFFFAAALLLPLAGQLALFYLICALCSLAGYGLGWLGELIVKWRDDK